jgi:hypothetical protein
LKFSNDNKRLFIFFSKDESLIVNKNGFKTQERKIKHSGEIYDGSNNKNLINVKSLDVANKKVG